VGYPQHCILQNWRQLNSVVYQSDSSLHPFHALPLSPVGRRSGPSTTSWHRSQVSVSPRTMSPPARAAVFGDRALGQVGHRLRVAASADQRLQHRAPRHSGDVGGHRRGIDPGLTDPECPRWSRDRRSCWQPQLAVIRIAAAGPRALSPSDRCRTPPRQPPELCLGSRRTAASACPIARSSNARR
jgi:hypothetical protein